MNARQYTVAEELSGIIPAYRRCVADGNEKWENRHGSILGWIKDQFLPQGSGFNSGTFYDTERSNRDRLVFTTWFYHMNQWGMYTHCREYTVKVTPCFGPGDKFDVEVHGVGRGWQRDHAIMDYIGEVFYRALEQVCRMGGTYGRVMDGKFCAAEIKPWDYHDLS